MLVRNKKALYRGLMLMVSFIGVFFLFFMPVFPGPSDGTKVTGLVFADNLFNTLSKGSANFFDATLKEKSDSVDLAAEKVKGKSIDIQIPFADEKKQALAVEMLGQNGFTASLSGTTLSMKGELYPLLKAIITDSLSTYDNDLGAVSARHNGADGRMVMETWWRLCTNMLKPLQRADQIEEASVVSTITSKAIEPSYNFLGIKPLKVRDNIPLVAGFLVFYVIYTMWYGFAIFEIFEGIGLTMKKSVKQEI